MSQTKGLSKVLGALEIIHYQDLNNRRLINVSAPVDSTDGVNKNYVDSVLIASNIGPGVGLNLNTTSSLVYDVIPSQTQITAIGTINTGIWNASTIQIPYGGTGSMSFVPNQLVYYGGTNALLSSTNLIYDGTFFNCSVPMSILNTTNSDGISTGSLSVYGGVNIKKKLYVNGDSIISGNISVGSISIAGSITLNDINANTAVFTGMSSSSIFTSNLTVQTNASISSMISNNINNGNMTTTNILTTNITNTNIITTNISSDTLNVSNVSAFNNTITNNQTVSTALIFIGTISNLVITNLTGNSLKISNSSTLANTFISNISTGTLNLTTITCNSSANILNTISTNGNFVNVTANSLHIISNATISNVSITNISSSSLIVSNTTNTTTISTGDIWISNSLTGIITNTNNLNAINQTITNSLISNITIGTLRVSNNSILSNTTLINLTASSIFINNNLNTTYLVGVSLTTGSLLSTGLSTFNGGINTNSISTGTINSTTNTTGNIFNNNTIYTNLLTTSNLSSNNGSISSLISTNISNTSLTSTNLLSTNVSCTNLNIINTTNVNSISAGNIFVTNLNNTNCTNSNIINTNLLTTNISTSTLKVTTSSSANTFIINGSINNLNVNNITSGTLVINSNSNFNKNISLQSNYQGINIATAGSFLNIQQCTFTDNTSISTSSVNNWYANYIATPILSAQNNNITTTQVANVYIQSNVNNGANQTLRYNAGLALGYVNNSSGYLTGQLMFERSDGSWFSSMYVENSTNKLVIANANLSGGGGIGIYTVQNTPIIFSNILSSTNTSNTPFIQFKQDTTNYYSTVDSSSLTSGSIILNGGMAIQKNLSISSLSYSFITISCTEGNTITMGSLGSNLVLKPNIPLTNLIITLPISSINGSTVFVTTNKTITNCSFGNSVIQTSTLTSSIPLRFMYVTSDSLWYSI
jgi:hypothetical protein